MESLAQTIQIATYDQVEMLKDVTLYAILYVILYTPKNIVCLLLVYRKICVNVRTYVLLESHEETKMMHYVDGSWNQIMYLFVKVRDSRARTRGRRTAHLSSSLLSLFQLPTCFTYIYSW